ATSAYISFDPVSVGPSRFTFGITPAPDADLDKIAAIVAEEVNRIAAEGVTETELENARKALEIDAVYARDSVMGSARILGEALCSGRDVPTVEAWPERSRAVTGDAVKAAAEEVGVKYKNVLIAVLTPEKVK